MIITLISQGGVATKLDTIDSKYVININDLTYTKCDTNLFCIDGIEYQLIKSYCTKTGKIEFFGLFNQNLNIK
jgi:hypothetical protein